MTVTDGAAYPSLQQAVELSPVLHKLSERASRYSINLNGRINRTLGRLPQRGSTAIVYQGTLIPDGTEVAIKTFRCTLSGSEADLKRLFREVHIWSKLRHENIVPLLGISTEFDSTLSIISEWMPLGNANTYVQNTENDPRPLLEDVASGLDYIHSHELGPVVHGDLKGLNVLVSSDHRALLSDFGLSTLNISTFSMSIDGVCGGSCHWMAPELLSGCPLSVASDVWAFGMTILELFTRAVPFRDCSSPANVFGKLMNGKLPPRPAQESTQFRLSDAWWEICMACWRSDPSSRPTMKNITENVKAAISQAGPALMPPETPASKVAKSLLIPRNLEVIESDTATDHVSESTVLMRTALEYPASAAHTTMSALSTEFFTCLVSQPPVMSENDKCILSAPPTADKNDSVNMNQNNLKDDFLSTAARLPVSFRSQMTPSPLTFKNESQGIAEACREDIVDGTNRFREKFDKVTGHRGVGVGHDLTSHTSEVKATRCTLEESSMVLVDTPGSDGTTKADLNVLEMISDWLNKEYRKGTTLAAILYFHRITDNHMPARTPLKNLRVFQKLCGKNAMPKVVLVTTMWDEVEEDVGQQRLMKLKDGYWKVMTSGGSTTFEYMNTQASAMQLLKAIECQERKQEGIRLQEEISEMGLELRETAAGQVLCCTLEGLAAMRMEALRKIQAGSKGTDEKAIQDLWKEYTQMNAQLTSALTEARLLKMSVKQRSNKSIRTGWRKTGGEKTTKGRRSM
ncbi:kinase-like domain-containing protein [Pisolithus orientalis]|uniref:kinase-like domain-containing protein n=1 Tax=Pisolithus orientalis TaxID=936130 RepID=UPI002224E387|nr:kinase-like domain-containing protein [Pisolithus orientalis]KAI6000347.1 kinase-like domain-containing protein [Pisolithus orientalis]